HAEEVAADRGRRVRETLQGLDEADARNEVQQRDEIQAHGLAPALFSSAGFLSFLRNISSMRRVTRKPPKMFTAASATASTPMVLPSMVSVIAAASMGPRMPIAGLAVVTA